MPKLQRTVESEASRAQTVIAGRPARVGLVGCRFRAPGCGAADSRTQPATLPKSMGCRAKIDRFRAAPLRSISPTVMRHPRKRPYPTPM